MYRYAIALTGSIATGKSTAKAYLQTKGYACIDADAIAHEVLRQQHEAIKQVFGSDFVSNGEVDRKSLGAYVFANPNAKMTLEGLLHPHIRSCIQEQAHELDQKAQMYFVDIPLFYETKQYDIAPVWLIYATGTLQLERLIRRNQFTAQEAQKRIDAQIDIEQKVLWADVVIDNTSTLQNLKKCLQKALKVHKANL